MTVKRTMQTIISLLGVFTLSSAGAFEAGTSQLSINAGSGRYYNESYLNLGLGYEYFISPGLQASAKVNLWFGGEHDIYQLTPGINYIVPGSWGARPYVGVFYQRNYIEGDEDIDASGFRAGVYVAAGSHAYVGYGVSYSELKDCDEAIYFNCSSTHTEISFVKAF